MPPSNDRALRIVLVSPVPPPYGGMALQAGLLARLLREDGHFVDLFPANFPLPQWLGPFGRLRGVKTLLRAGLIMPKLWARYRKADVVHIFAASWFYFFLVVCPAALVAASIGKRTVINYRGGEAGPFFRKFGFLAGPFLRMASSVTCPSAFLGRLIGERFGIPTQIVPNIVDLSRFQYRQRKGFSPSFLVTRHLEPMYDIPAVVRAFASVQQRFPGASLTIAGAGSEEASLRALVSELRAANVRFLGHVPHDGLAQIYAESDVYVNASRVDNFPGALIEASASGLAIVTTDAGGIPWMFENERTALISAVGDWKALARNMERVLDRPAESAAMTAAAAADARRCEWHHVRRALYPVYGFRTADAAQVEGNVLNTAAGRNA